MDKSPDSCDWEVLHNSSASDSAAEELGVVEQQLDSSCGAVFLSDYFSFDSHQKPPSSDDGSALSDNPSWIEPAYDVPFPHPPRNSADFLSDSGNDLLSDSRRLIDGYEKVEPSDKTNLVKYWSDSGQAFSLDYKNDTLLEELGVQGDSMLGFDSCGVGIGIIQHPLGHEKEYGDSCGVQGDSMLGFDSDADNEATQNEVTDDEVGSNSTRGLVTGEMKPVEKEEESARVVWWKLPLDLFKYCVFKVSPVWSLSVAAAVVGFVILGRRLYKMKRKTHGLKLKVIIDDKRVSQLMSHAARLNEAFSLVRRVPIVRPSPPAPGAASWYVMSMR